MQNALRFFARHALTIAFASLLAVLMVAPFASTVAVWVTMAAPALIVGLAATSILALQNSYELSLAR